MEFLSDLFYSRVLSSCIFWVNFISNNIKEYIKKL